MVRRFVLDAGISVAIAVPGNRMFLAHPNQFLIISNVVSISRPKKNKSDKPVDPELLKRVEEKLAHFVIHEQEASSAAPTVP